MKKYAVQYAYDLGMHGGGISFSNVKIPTDTNPIPYDEALTIFNNHLDDFKRRLRDNERPHLVMWDDVGDDEFPNYHKELIDLDWRDDLEYTNGKFYRTVKSEIKLPE